MRWSYPEQFSTFASHYASDRRQPMSTFLAKKTGILGGGQLGKMLAQAAADWHLPIYALDASRDYPAGLCATGMVVGSYQRREDVLAFGRQMDVLTIEIEHVHTGALRELQAMGKVVHPNPVALELIKDKGAQKEFFQKEGLPTAPYQLFPSAQAIAQAVQQGRLSLPFVQKTRTAGYDGKGVQVVRTSSDVSHLLQGPSVVEPLCDIDKELAVLVARNARGECAVYDPVEMVFHPQANLVELLVCPARLPNDLAQQAQQLARRTIEAFDICGLLAVEMFLLRNGTLWLNEVAPRPHNSGHHTIEAAATSQFQQHLRAIHNLALGPTALRKPAAMVNLLGAADSQPGRAHWQGVDRALQLSEVYVHNYGKAFSRPFRKMGHATVLAPTVGQAIERARQVQQWIRIEGVQ